MNCFSSFHACLLCAKLGATTHIWIAGSSVLVRSYPTGRFAALAISLSARKGVLAASAIATISSERTALPLPALRPAHTILILLLDS